MFRNIVIVAADRVARVFTMSSAPRVITLDISIAFDRDWRVGLFHKFISHGIFGQSF